jgi:membrane protein DedA with SNARE-associated domain
MVDSIIAYVSTLRAGWLYLALFLSSFVENVFPPVPGDTVTVFAAYLVGRAQQGWAGVFTATNLGSIAGFMTYYALGRLIHPEYFIRKDFRFLPAASFKSAGEWFQRYGYWVVLFNRFLSGLRSVIAIVCGMYRLPWLRVLLLTTIGCSIWNGLLMWAGYQLGANWRNIEGLLRQYSRFLLLVAVAAAVIWYLRKKSAPSGDRP